MARKPRLHFPGAFYHVILRGNAGNNIFFADKDASRFLLLLQEGIERYRNRIHAYCLMTNHVHLAIQVGEVPLSRIMQNVSFRYTRYINSRKKQVGHLFQGRYKALLVDADSYLLELVRYIHNNPVRAKIVTSPEKYPWSSHASYLGRVTVPWLTTDWILSQFAEIEQTAIEKYEEYVLHGTGEKQRKEFYQGNVEGRILGNEHFVNEVLSKTSSTMPRKTSLNKVIQAVCNHYNLRLEDLSSRSREKRISEPRAVAAFLVREIEHLSLTDLGHKLRRDLSGLSQAASRFEKRLASGEKVIQDVDTIRKHIL